MRTPLVAGNWKMHGTRPDAVARAAAIERGVAGLDGVEVLVCPPFTALQAVSEALGTRVGLGAQDVHWEPQGAFTGEVAAAMLTDLGCRYVLVGHSERRALCHETDRDVRRKARAALGAGLRPIVCVGETLEQREAGRTEDVVRAQIDGGLGDLGPDLGGVVVAYEPVWAIGTGRTATAEQAQSVHRMIRERLEALAGEAVAREVRILYGGSVKPANAAELFGRPDIDGGLVGGASLDPDAFLAIVRGALVAPGAGGGR